MVINAFAHIAALRPLDDDRALARAITIVENDMPDAKALLQGLPFTKHVPVIGITGPPGAGKSTLVNALLHHAVQHNKRIGVLAVDPSSPFNYGALLGDRVRMSGYFNNPNIFIRSVATRGALGGLCEKIIEITDVMRHGNFDMIYVETVGVGQSEVEIAGLADTTVIVLVPQAGDEVQTMKAGLMEIADIYVVNKSDQPAADALYKSLALLAHERDAETWKVPVLKTVASEDKGIAELMQQVTAHNDVHVLNEKKIYLQTEKLYRLIQQRRMAGITRSALQQYIQQHKDTLGFNLYQAADFF